MVALGGAMELFLAHYDRLRARRALWAISGALAVAGAVQSARRQSAWRSEDVFFSQLERDAPRTYRAHLVASVHYFTTGQYPEAERAARRGLELYQGDPQLYEQLGQVLRVQRRCGEAIPFLSDGVQRFPDRTVARSRLIECLLAVGDTVKALTVANQAVQLGQSEFSHTVERLQIRRVPDGALR
jgi:predicted Zn-dependent protease